MPAPAWYNKKERTGRDRPDRKGGGAMAGQPKHEQVSEWLRERIRSGEWKDGDKLLSEHELARRFGISRQTVRQAVGTLVNEGLLLRRQGSGTYVAGRGGTPRSRSGTIGVVTTYLDRYVFPDIIHGIEQVLTAAGYQMQLGITHNRTQDEGAVLASMLKSRVDGLIVEPTKSALPNPNLPLYRKIGEENIPVIFLNGYYAMLDIPHVSADDYAAGKTAARCLLEHGHRQLFGIFKSDDIQGHFRFSGFVHALQEAGLVYDDSGVLWYVTEDLEQIFSPENDRYLLERLAGHSAAVCYNDEVACVLEETLRRNGLAVPEDISLVSFDNSSLATLGGMALSSVDYPFWEIGQTAARQMVACLETGARLTGHSFPPRLMERDSVKSL